MPQFKLVPIPSGDTTIASIQDENDQLLAAYNRGQLNIDPNQDQTALIFREGNLIRHIIPLTDIDSPAVNSRTAAQYIVDELSFFFRKLSLSSGTNGESYSLSGVFDTTELLTLALAGSQGTNSAVNIQFPRIGQTLLVSPAGDDAFALRESIRNHFSSLEEAVNTAQSGDSVLVVGTVAIPNTILINGKDLRITCLGVEFTDTAIGPMFQLNMATVSLTGNYSINRPNGSLIRLQANAEFILDGFNEVNVRSGFSIGTSSKAIARNGKSLTISTIGNGAIVNVCGDDSELVYDNIIELGCVADNFSTVGANGAVTLQHIDSFTFDGLRLCSYSGTAGRGKLKLKAIAEAQLTGLGTTALSSGAIAGTLDAEISNSTINCNARFIASANALAQGSFTIKDSEIVCGIATPIRISGSLVCRNSRIVAPFAAPVIEYSQSNTDYNEIAESRLENSGGHVLDFTGDPNSKKLNIHNNQLSGGFADDTQIVASKNSLIAGEEVDLGPTSSLAMTIDFSTGSVFTITLTQDLTLTFENVFQGKEYAIIFLQDAVGNHEVSLPAECIFNGSNLHPSFSYPAEFVVKMQLKLERMSTAYHCNFQQFSS